MEVLDAAGLAERLRWEDKEYCLHLEAESPLEKYPAKQHARRVQEKLGIEEGLIYLPGQLARNNDDSDMPAPFRQRRYFYYVSGCNEADCHLAYDVQRDVLTLFIPRIKPERVIWNGRGSTRAEALVKYDIDQVFYADELEYIIQKWAFDNRHAGIYVLHPSSRVPGCDNLMPRTDAHSLLPAMNICRMIKDDHEINLIRKANDISSQAHRQVLENILEFENEAQVEGLFMDVCISHQAKQQAYAPIAASGPNAGTLHYDSNNEDFAGRQLMCLDAGCEYELYASDITRSFPLSSSWPSREAENIYKLVQRMQETCIERLGPGVRYLDLHILAHQIAIDGLLQLGILHNGTKEEIFKAGTSRAFFPHGLGHHVGLEVHDPGQAGLMSVQRGKIVHQQAPSLYPENFHTPVYSAETCLAPADPQSSQLEEGMVVTVEPGIYFSVYALQQFYLPSPIHSKYINVEALRRYLPVGGVRIEDDILITAKGYENLTTAPKGDAMLEIIKHGSSKIADGPHRRTTNSPRLSNEADAPPLLRAPGISKKMPQPLLRPLARASTLPTQRRHKEDVDFEPFAGPSLFANFSRSMTTEEKVQQWREKRDSMPVAPTDPGNVKSLQSICGETTPRVRHVYMSSASGPSSMPGPIQERQGSSTCRNCVILVQTLGRLRQNLSSAQSSPASAAVANKEKTQLNVSARDIKHRERQRMTAFQQQPSRSEMNMNGRENTHTTQQARFENTIPAVGHVSSKLRVSTFPQPNTIVTLPKGVSPTLEPSDILPTSRHQSRQKLPVTTPLEMLSEEEAIRKRLESLQLRLDALEEREQGQPQHQHSAHRLTSRPSMPDLISHNPWQYHSALAAILDSGEVINERIDNRGGSTLAGPHLQLRPSQQRGAPVMRDASGRDQYYTQHAPDQIHIAKSAGQDLSLLKKMEPGLRDEQGVKVLHVEFGLMLQKLTAKTRVDLSALEAPGFEIDALEVEVAIMGNRKKTAHGYLDRCLALLKEEVKRVGEVLVHASSLEPAYTFNNGTLKFNETGSDPAEENLVTSDSIFRVMSISKHIAMTSALVVENQIRQNSTDGLSGLTMDTPVRLLLPSFALPQKDWADGGSEITLRMLASHTAGIPRESYSTGFNMILSTGKADAPTIGAAWAGQSAQDVIDGIATRSLMFAPGQRAASAVAAYYNNITGLDLAWSDLATQELLGPLNMTHSFFGTIAQDLIPQISVPGGENWADLIVGEGYDPAAGMWSSANDLSNFLYNTWLAPQPALITDFQRRNVMKPSIILQDGIQQSGPGWEIELLTLPTSGNASVAESSMKTYSIFGKSGNGGGWSSWLDTIPNLGYGLVVLAQTSGLTDYESIAPSTLKSTMHDFLAPAFAKALSARMKERFAGTYSLTKDTGLIKDQVVTTAQSNSLTYARLEVEDQILYIRDLVVNGTSALEAVDRLSWTADAQPVLFSGPQGVVLEPAEGAAETAQFGPGAQVWRMIFPGLETCDWFDFDGYQDGNGWPKKDASFNSDSESLEKRALKRNLIRSGARIVVFHRALQGSASGDGDGQGKTPTRARATIDAFHARLAAAEKQQFMNRAEQDQQEFQDMYSPCNSSSTFHDLQCGHRIQTEYTASCGVLCARPVQGQPFICPTCLIDVVRAEVALEGLSLKLNDGTAMEGVKTSAEEEVRRFADKYVAALLRKGYRACKAASKFDEPRLQFFDQFMRQDGFGGLADEGEKEEPLSPRKRPGMATARRPTKPNVHHDDGHAEKWNFRDQAPHEARVGRKERADTNQETAESAEDGMDGNPGQSLEAWVSLPPENEATEAVRKAMEAFTLL
ncbi:xaa-pro dipeptidase [Stemphylium lycopersici]|uniref:Xaa-Pro aminopeptidase n=1 Tax=Stemphylium lycopersici TaxID=183478 RepID=A0A364N449_STELY|nr:xaa-pro dipeptidase [Stemphylium lycopersici]